MSLQLSSSSSSSTRALLFSSTAASKCLTLSSSRRIVFSCFLTICFRDFTSERSSWNDTEDIISYIRYTHNLYNSKLSRDQGQETHCNLRNKRNNFYEYLSIDYAHCIFSFYLPFSLTTWEVIGVHTRGRVYCFMNIKERERVFFF